VIEVAIGEYGTDTLVGLFDTTKIININGHNKCHNIYGEDHEAIKLEIREFLSYYKNYRFDGINKLQYKSIRFVGECQEDNNTNDEKLPHKTELLNKPPLYVQIYYLYLRNVTMYKRNKVSK